MLFPASLRARAHVAVRKRLAVAQREVNAEIDAQADEQDGEGDRDDVERVESGNREGGGPGQARDQRRHRRHHEAERLQADDQKQDHEAEGQQADDAHILLHRLQLFLQHQRIAGHADPNAPALVELQRFRGRVDGVDRRADRLERRLVEHRLHDDIFPRRGAVFALVGVEQRLPGKPRVASFLHASHGRRHLVERGAQGSGRLGVALVDRQAENVRQAAERRIGAEGRQQGLGLRQQVAHLLEISRC